METIDDIVREMRGNAEHNHALVEVSKYLAEIADRIENAYEHGYHALEGHCKRLENAYEKQVQINRDLVDENARLHAALQPVLNAKPHSSDQQEHEDMPYYKVLVKCHNAVRKAQEIYKQGEKQMNEIVVRMSPCITPDIVKHINAHLAKAARKHPKFCEELTDGWSVHHYDNRMKTCKAYSEIHCNGETVLDEEIAEALHAIASEDWLHARSEIFDAIAVLLRMDEEIVNRIENHVK